ncbi:B-cell receptor-associated protein 29 isoform X2 [Gorilla gorilla gorilla]|uniref:B-cell receptor-associated protein 29 isoform X2 n=1 Tax=Gorilla gorilla gorilla TaxID=9595 RepID=UPI00300A1FD2
MTLQWAAVATFLYAEIGLILIFCLPFIPPQRWQKIFSFNVWGKIATFWNKAFLTIIILLIVLFLDAVREVRKYSSVHTIEKSSTSRPDAYEHTQMKLFRSQRNLYISGFSLFFWLVLRRLVTLITQLAKELSNKGVLKTQAENTNKAAKKFMEENEKLKRILKSHGKDEECVLEAENKKLVEDQEKLKTELRKTSDALSKAQNDVMEMKMQSERLSKEYDQLLKEHSELQKSHSQPGAAAFLVPLGSFYILAFAPGLHNPHPSSPRSGGGFSAIDNPRGALPPCLVCVLFHHL